MVHLKQFMQQQKNNCFKNNNIKSQFCINAHGSRGEWIFLFSTSVELGSQNVCLSVCLLVCLSQTLGQHILSLWHFLTWTPVFMESLGLSPGGIFFFFLPNFDFWALQVATGNLFGTKICGEIRLSYGDQTFRIWSVSR